jgi:predicted aspartyl protease
MGLIYKQVKLTGPKASQEFTALMDTGASESFIRSEEAQMIATPYKMPEPMSLELGREELEVDEVIFAYVDLDGVRLHWTFMVVPDLTEQVIIGADFFQRWKIRLHPETEKIIFDPKALKLKLV